MSPVAVAALVEREVTKVANKAAEVIAEAITESDRLDKELRGALKILWILAYGSENGEIRIPARDILEARFGRLQRMHDPEKDEWVLIALPPDDEPVDVEAQRCPIAEDKTNGQFFCTRAEGHEGPCAAHPVNGTIPIDPNEWQGVEGTNPDN